MGRKRAERPLAARPADAEPRGDAPVGGARVAWAQLAGLLALVVAGLGFAVSDVVQAARCDSDDVTCTLGTYLVGTLVSAVAGLAIVARVFRLGWEWALVVASVVLALPLLLDLAGNWAWLAAALAPTLGALLTLDGRQRPRWRPVAIGVGCGLALAVVALWTFFPPGG
nr:hypothetical protein [Propionibacterium sp.]